MRVYGIDAGWQCAQPVVDVALESGDAGESALRGWRVAEIEDALHSERQRRFEHGVPVQVRARELEARALGRIEANPIGGHDEVLVVPQLRERLVDAQRRARRLQCRMLEQLHHDALAPLRGVPGVRVVDIRADVRVHGGERGGAFGRRDRLLDDHVAVRVPVREIGGVEHRRQRAHAGMPLLHLGRMCAALLQRIDPRGAHRRDRAVVAIEHEALQRFEGRHRRKEARHLLRPDADTVDEHAIEMLLARVALGRTIAVQRAQPARPVITQGRDGEIVGGGRRIGSHAAQSRTCTAFTKPLPGAFAHATTAIAAL